jgi:hypothetical protein
MSLHDEVADMSFRGQSKKNAPTPHFNIFHKKFVILWQFGNEFPVFFLCKYAEGFGSYGAG